MHRQLRGRGLPGHGVPPLEQPRFRVLAAPYSGLPGRLLVLIVGLLLVLVSGSAPVAPTRAAGGELRYLGGELKTLDPAFIADAGDVQLLLQLYAGLTRLDENGAVYPSLATSWDVSQDGRTYTFHLADGLRFSDGSPLDASDVRRSWLRLLDPATHATAPDVLSIISGARERLAGGAEEDVGLQAPDARTLVVSLRHPASYFTSITATPAAFVVPRTADASQDWQTADGFVGSGPYLADGRDGSDLLLAANPNYVAGAPPIARVRWLTDLDGDPVTAFADDQLDLTGVSPADAGWIAYDQRLGPHLHKAAALDVQYFGFDTTRAPFDDARVRRAFLLALDRPRLVELASGSAGVAATSLVPPALQPEGFPTDAEADLAQARRLLDAAGYADRSKLGPIVVNASGLDAGPAAATWESELGVDISLETMDFSDYLPTLERDPPQIFTINWIADYPSPYALYSLLLLPDAASNYGRWQDDRFVKLLEAAASGDDPAQAARAYAAVERRVTEQAPVIPWSYGETWWLTASGLRGLGSLTTGLLDFGRLSWDT